MKTRIPHPGASLSPSPEKRGTKWLNLRFKLIILALSLMVLISIAFTTIGFSPNFYKDKPSPATQPVQPALNLNSSLSERAETTGSVKLNGRVIVEKLYVVDGNSERGSLGLSGISDLKNSGMLFYYPDAKSVNFWMKDMKIDLDIIWLGCDGQILGWQAGAKPSDYPKTYTSPKLNYVLEVEGGFINEHQLKIGDRLEFDTSGGLECGSA